jgi:hypothetical protein
VILKTAKKMRQFANIFYSLVDIHEKFSKNMEPVTFDLKRHNHASAFFRAIVDLYEKESDSVSEICAFIGTIKVTCSDLKFDTEE